MSEDDHVGGVILRLAPPGDDEDAAPATNPEAVALLERALARAESGEITSVIVIACGEEWPEGYIGISVPYTLAPSAYLGCAQAQRQLLLAIEETGEDG